MQDSTRESSKRRGEVSSANNGTGANDAHGASADTDVKTCERKPSKITFKDYYVDRVCCRQIT